MTRSGFPDRRSIRGDQICQINFKNTWTPQRRCGSSILSYLWTNTDQSDPAGQSGRKYGADIPLDIKVAVMGCVVNGPGEAKEADIGIAGGIGEGLIIKHGEVFKKVPESELLEALRYELLHWNE